MMDLLKQDKERWVGMYSMHIFSAPCGYSHTPLLDFMMKFELALEKPDRRRSYIAALTIGISYFVG